MAQRLAFDISVDLLDRKWVIDFQYLHEVLTSTLLGGVTRTSVSRTVGIAGHRSAIQLTTAEALADYRLVKAQLTRLCRVTHVPASTPPHG